MSLITNVTDPVRRPMSKFQLPGMISRRHRAADSGVILGYQLGYSGTSWTKMSLITYVPDPVRRPVSNFQLPGTIET